jgi:hypothetical protein
MPDWLFDSFAGGREILWHVLIYRLSVAFAFGCAVAGIYWLTHRRDETLATSFLATLVLLSILIAIVTQVIGKDLARAFGLVGALSIVRFRTVVEDTRDTAFVIFAVVVGMAAGGNEVAVALVGLPIVALAAALLRSPRAEPGANPYWTLTVRFGLATNPEEVVGAIIRERFEEAHLLATATGRQGAALDLTYRVRLRPTSSPSAIVADLNRLEGIQNVELRR